MTSESLTDGRHAMIQCGALYDGRTSNIRWHVVLAVGAVARTVATVVASAEVVAGSNGWLGA
jgi:hypothetical protein